MLVVRERPEDAVQRTVVQVARDLHLPPDAIRPWVRVKVGQSVDRDQWLAAAGRPWEMRVSPSPVRGRIRHIDFDYGVITNAFADLKERLDHSYLNEVEGLENPTSEILAGWIWERLAPRLPSLSEVLVRETCTTACRYRGPNGF